MEVVGGQFGVKCDLIIRRRRRRKQRHTVHKHTYSPPPSFK
jgi:hypothetical protein